MPVTLLWTGANWTAETEADDIEFSSDNISMSVSLWKANKNNVRTENITHELIDGDVTLDMTNVIHLSSTFKIKNPAQVIAYVDYLAPFLNIEYNDGRRATHHQLGLFTTQMSPGTYTIEDSIGTIHGGDLCTVLADDHFTTPLNLAAGANVVTAVKNILISAGITRHVIPSSSKVLAKKRSYKAGRDKLSACNSLLHEVGYYGLCTDTHGYVTTPGPVRSIRSTHPWRTLTADDVLAPIEVTPTNDGRLANVVVATGSDAKEHPLRSIQKNEHPSSPISTVSIGRKIVKEVELSGKITQSELDAYAEKQLELAKSYYRTAVFKVLPDSDAFEAQQAVIVDLDGKSSHLSGRWWISGATMGFTSANALVSLTLNQYTRMGLATDEIVTESDI